MNHQPYETWLLAAEPLTPEQDALLRAHVAACPECRRVQAGWQAASGQLANVRLVSPTPGFSRRFSESLAARRARQAHLNQIRWLIMGLSIGVASTSLLLAVMVFTSTSPVSLLVRVTEIITGAFSLWGRASQLLIVSLQQPLVLGIWILLTSGVCLLTFGWLVTLWRISSQGAQQ